MRFLLWCLLSGLALCSIAQDKTYELEIVIDERVRTYLSSSVTLSIDSSGDFASGTINMCTETTAATPSYDVTVSGTIATAGPTSELSLYDVEDNRIDILLRIDTTAAAGTLRAAVADIESDLTAAMNSYSDGWNACAHSATESNDQISIYVYSDLAGAFDNVYFGTLTLLVSVT